MIAPRALARVRNRRGQALAEMAIVLPILIAMLVGIFELGRAWNVRQVITNAAREGARLAVVQSTGDDATVTAAVNDRLADAGLNPGLATLTLVDVGGGTGSIASVTVSYPYEFLFLGPVIDLLGGGGDVPGSITLSSTARMRNE